MTPMSTQRPATNLLQVRVVFDRVRRESRLRLDIGELTRRRWSRRVGGALTLGSSFGSGPCEVLRDVPLAQSCSNRRFCAPDLDSGAARHPSGTPHVRGVQAGTDRRTDRDRRFRPDLDRDR